MPAFAGGMTGPVVEPDPIPAAAAKSLGWYGYGMIGGTFDGPSYRYGPEDQATDVDLSGPSLTVGIGREISRRGALSIGFEADLTAGGIDSAHIEGGTYPCLTGEGGCEAAVDWLATARLVLGWKTGNTMPYVTAGLAAGDISGFADAGACGYIACGFDGTETGWTAGLGFRHELSDRWALKGEVLYIDLGSPDFPSASVTSDFTFSQVRLGTIYKF